MISCCKYLGSESLTGKAWDSLWKARLCSGFPAIRWLATRKDVRITEWFRSNAQQPCELILIIIVVMVLLLNFLIPTRHSSLGRLAGWSALWVGPLWTRSCAPSSCLGACAWNSKKEMSFLRSSLGWGVTWSVFLIVAGMGCLSWRSPPRKTRRSGSSLRGSLGLIHDFIVLHILTEMKNNQRTWVLCGGRLSQMSRDQALPHVWLTSASSKGFACSC